MCIWPESAVLTLRIPISGLKAPPRWLHLTLLGSDLNRLGGDWEELGRHALPTRIRLGDHILQDWMEPPQETGAYSYQIPTELSKSPQLELTLEPREPSEVTVNRVPIPLAELWLS